MTLDGVDAVYYIAAIEDENNIYQIMSYTRAADEETYGSTFEGIYMSLTVK